VAITSRAVYDAALSSDAALAPSPCQRQAIEAPPGATLVLAGPGSGKTFCLIERIRHLIEDLGVAPERICAFTFTNKAAGEIGVRLERTLGIRATRVKSGTIHAFCAELLREHGTHVGLEPGFGIADETYQRTVLRRLSVPPQFHAKFLTRLAAHRFLDEPLHPKDVRIVESYENFLATRNVVDFDLLLIKAQQLLGDEETATDVRSRWDCVLVDEFQDLNPVQYAVIRALAREHRHLFAVGDDEQSIYSWAGADPRVFRALVNDFGITAPIPLHRNRRCPRQVVALARHLVAINTPIFADRTECEADRDSAFPVGAFSFATDDAEIAWIIDDMRRDRDAHGLAWGDFALLYRRHHIGNSAEASLLAAGLPCRLAHGHALVDDPVAEYVIAALRVIASDDEVSQEAFLDVVLPGPLMDAARARADENERSVLSQLDHTARRLARDDGDRKKIRRALYTLSNLAAIGRRHTSLATVIAELLSQRVGVYRTILEEHHDALSDPCAHDEVVRLAAVIESGRRVWIPPLGGLDVALEGMLAAVGVCVSRDATQPHDTTALSSDDGGALGLPLAIFKAAQLVRSRGFTNAFRDFTTVDLETTGKDAREAEVVEIAAVRVRGGAVVEEFHSLVRPSMPIPEGATGVHGITDVDVATAPTFDEIWAPFRAFCGNDVLVAHNGLQYDFPILCRMSMHLPGGGKFCTYDTLPLARDLQPGSGKLVDLARMFGVEAPESHRALQDARTLVGVFLALGDAKIARARKTALADLLDYLGLALALSNTDALDAEGQLLRRLCRAYALGRYSDCLDFYAAKRDESMPTMREVIDRLGGEKAMRRIQAEKTADERYPVAMARLRRLIPQCSGATLREQIAAFLERVALSRSDGIDTDNRRVNLLTLHSTKGLEFSRVYIVGVEDEQLLGKTKAELEEARRLLYVGMTRAKDRLVLTRVETRGGNPTGGHRFLDEMGIAARVVS
jgi:DNA polymerase III epsilon subunit family exonuclease